jgi:hypothetical protein
MREKRGEIREWRVESREERAVRNQGLGTSLTTAH